MDIQIGPGRVLHIKLKTREGRPRRVFGRLVTSRLKLTVEANGDIQVTVPKRISQNLIEEFVLGNLDWIEKQQIKQAARRELDRIKNPPRRFQAGEMFRFYGTERKLVFETTERAKLSFEIVENLLVAHLPTDLAQLAAQPTSPSAALVAKLRKGLARFTEAEARRHLTERMDFWAKKMGLQFTGLSFRNQKTRWGSCSTTGHISLNWKLVFAPEPVIDYVLIHELAHLEHPNHSTQFWVLVEKFDPKAREHRRWLRDHQLETQIFDQSISP